MTRGEKYRAEAQSLDRAVAAKMDEADALMKVGEGETVADDVRERADAIYVEAGKLAEQAGTWRERAKEADARDERERADDAERQRNKWKERAQEEGGRPTTRDMSKLPTEEELRERNRNIKLMLRGEQHDEAAVALAYPQEDVFVMLLREEQLGNKTPAHLRVSADDRKAFESFIELQERAITPTGNTTVAGKGLEFVPENMDMRIQSEMKYVGGFSDLAGLTVAQQNNPGVFKALKETAVVSWSPDVRAEATDAALKEPATAAVDITMEELSLGTILTDQQLMTGNADLQAFIIGGVGRAYGREINKRITAGTGTGGKGIIGITSKQARKDDVATTKVLAEADLVKLFSKVDWAYIDEGTPSVHVHPATIIYLWKQRDAGTDLYPRTPDGLSVTIFGRRVTANPALNTLIVGGAGPVALLGQPRNYQVVHDGPLRYETARGYEGARSGQRLLVWRQMIGGAPVIDEAFAWLNGV